MGVVEGLAAVGLWQNVGGTLLLPFYAVSPSTPTALWCCDRVVLTAACFTAFRQGIELMSMVNTPGRRHLVPVPLSGLLYSLCLVAKPRIEAPAGREEPTAGKILVGLGIGVAGGAILRHFGTRR